MNAGKTAVTAHGGIDWNASGGSADSNDLTFAQALFARFGGERINQITVTDSRSDAAGGLGTDVMYGIEHIEFRSGEFGDMFDLSPSISRDNSGNALDFWGTNFGDVFVGDAGSTWVNAQGGNDWIIALNGADRIQPGAGADYVNAGANDNGPTGDNWFRDEVSFWDTPYARTEVSQIKVQVHNTTGDILLHAADSDGVRDDHFLIYNYSGSAAQKVIVKM